MKATSQKTKHKKTDVISHIGFLFRFRIDYLLFAKMLGPFSASMVLASTKVIRSPL